ncbi:MAG: acyl-CoA dehydrogenase [Gammaproteobacteria bacterium]
MQFVINEMIGLDKIRPPASIPGPRYRPRLFGSVLEEAAKLASDVLGPLNKTGDRQGARLTVDGVIAADGFKDAYRQFTEGGWNGLALPSEFQGQGLPELLATAVQEMWNSSNLAFALCPLLTAGAVEAILVHGSAEQKALYLNKMVSGQWTGTMNLTEPQAGSDLSAVRTRAVPEGDHYRIFGQKIFITWGDHDVAENIVHLALARTPNAPEGVKGISLFIVPKFLPNPDGSPGQRNDVRCASLEHKLGIHASPTCVMAYGDHDGAIGYRVGEENQGLAYMFTMMNEARLKVGLEGLSVAERAYQQARDHAKTRVQGRPVGVKHGERVTIIHHPDVRRMLMTMKSQVEAMRAFCYAVAEVMDIARHHPDRGARQHAQATVDLLIPVVKGWCTEVGVELASLGIQVHGGMGFIEETGAAQTLRDARIITIYEGTTGIQAADLAGRKLTMDGGQTMRALVSAMRDFNDEALAKTDGDDIAAIRRAFTVGIGALSAASEWMIHTMNRDPNAALAASTPYLMLAGYVCGGWQMARAAVVAKDKLAQGDNSGFYQAKLITARFYMEQILPKASALLMTVTNAGATTLALAEEQF